MTNVLLVMTDDQPYFSLTPEFMPYLMSNPGGGWQDMAQATLPQPICGPARGRWPTGQYSLGSLARGNSLQGVGSNDAPLNCLGGVSSNIRIERVLHEAGVKTAFAGKYTNGFPHSEKGSHAFAVPPYWDHFRGIDMEYQTDSRYTDWRVLREGKTKTTYFGDDTANYISDVEAADLAAWVASVGEPWFAVWTTYAPHVSGAAGAASATPAPRHAALYPDFALPTPPNFNPASIAGKPSWQAAHTPNQLTAARIDELAAEAQSQVRTLRSIDEGIQTIIEAIPPAEWDDTVVIYWTDNPNIYGNHRRFGKPHYFEESVNALMRVRWPGSTNGTSQALVSDIDIAPTVADIFGVKLPQPPDGQSMAPVLDGAMPADRFRRELLLEISDRGGLAGSLAGHGLRRVGTKYVVYANGDREHYDLTSDPYELTNLGQDTELDGVVAALRRDNK